MHRLRRVSSSPFGILAHVQQYRLGTGCKFPARLGDADFVDMYFGLGHEFEKTR